MKHVFYYIILCFPLFSFGQNNFLNSAQSLGIADCYTTQKGIWSTTTNISGGANNKNISIGIGIKNNFGLRELNNKTAIGLIPTNSGVFGLSVQQYGFSQYNENKFGLSFAKKLSETIYDDRDVIKSGWDEIEGNKLTELKIQLRYKF